MEASHYEARSKEERGRRIRRSRRNTAISSLESKLTSRAQRLNILFSCWRLAIMLQKISTLINYLN
jgi:hypothetical protein